MDNSGPLQQTALVDAASVVAAQIETATERFVSVLAGVDARSWMITPETDHWNLSEVVEHVTLANRNLVTRLQSLQPIETPPDVTDDEMPYLFYQAPEPPAFAEPTGTWTEIDVAVEQLRASAKTLVEWEGDAGIDVRAHGFAHPLFGMLDGAQWLRFSAVHTWRHRAQLQALRRVIGA